jgi:hypothetical protein
MGGPNNNDDIIDSEDEIFDNARELKKSSVAKGPKTLRASRKQLGNLSTSQVNQSTTLSNNRPRHGSQLRT